MSRRRIVKDEDRSGAIAVIEEIADNIYSVKFILQSLGFDVRSFAGSSDFLPDLLDLKPDLVIVDMMMSNGGAYAVIRSLRESFGKKLPILAITAEAMEGAEADVYKAGVQDVLTKPYAVTELQEKLQKWMGRSRRR